MGEDVEGAACEVPAVVHAVVQFQQIDQLDPHFLSTLVGILNSISSRAHETKDFGSLLMQQSA